MLHPKYLLPYCELNLNLAVPYSFLPEPSRRLLVSVVELQSSSFHRLAAYVRGWCKIVHIPKCYFPYQMNRECCCSTRKLGRTLLTSFALDGKHLNVV